MRYRFSQILVLVVTLFQAALAQRADLSGLKFCIDPGHGGYGSNDRHIVPDAGVDFYESESNFQKALLLKRLLEAKGAWVVLTRNSNSGQTYPNPNDPDEPSLSARWQLANANNVDWFHSIHSNATSLPLGQNLTTNYTLMLVKENISTRQAAWPEAVSMSNLIGPSIQRKLRTTPRSTYTYLDYTFYGGPPNGFNLGVLSGLAMPGELSEGSFHDNYAETRRLMNYHYRKMEAYALRDAFLTYFQVPLDTLCIVAGILKNSSGVPMNGVKVKILPEGTIFNGDNFNNGFYMFDSLRAGTHTLSFETPNYAARTQTIQLTAGTTTFFDGSFEGGVAAGVTYNSPTSRDTLYPISQWVAVGFSQPMDTSSVRQAFSIAPQLSGTFSWYNGSTLVWFKPSQPFQFGTRYTYRIDGSARTTAGGLLDGNGDGVGGDAFTVSFRTEPGVVSVSGGGAATAFALYQNYPNPFNPATAISYQIVDQDVVTLRVFDLLGREVTTLVNGVQSAGQHVVRWDGRNYRGEGVSSGIYLYQLRAGSSVLTREMVLLK